MNITIKNIKMTQIKITKTQATKLKKELDKYSRIKENLTISQILTLINMEIREVKKQNLQYLFVQNTYSVARSYGYTKEFVQFKCEFSKTGIPKITIQKSGAISERYGGGASHEVVPQYY